MSDVGLKASQYERSSALATKVERLVAQVASGTVASAQTRVQLATLLQAVSDLLRPLDATGISSHDALSLPSGTLRKLRRERIGSEPLPEVLLGTVERLRNVTDPLPAADLDILRVVAVCAQRDAAEALSRVIRR